MAPASAPEHSAATAAAAAPAEALAAAAAPAAAFDAPPEALEPTESDALVAPAVEPPAGATAPTASPSPAAGAPAAPPSRAALAIVFWLAMSCVQILFNKALFSGPFRYPVTLTAVHMTFASVATWTLRAAGVITAPELPGGWSFYVQKFGLIALLFSTALASGNVAAARLSVSFVHILKAITPVVTLFVGIVVGVNKPCYKLMGIVTVISTGVVIASMGELDWDALGFTLQMAAVLSESTRLVAMQLLLHKHLPKASPLVLLSFFTPLAAVCLTAVALYAEPGGFQAIPAVAPLVALNTVSSLVLNVAVMLLVSTTSGLTLVLAGIVKDIIVIVTSMFLFASAMAPIQAGGYFLALFGLALNDAYKQSEGKSSPWEIVRSTVWSLRMLAICVAVPLVALASHVARASASPGGPA